MSQAPARSTFVTVLAWIFIVLSGFGTVVSLLQNLMIWTLFNSPEVTQGFQSPPPPGMPAGASLLATHFHYFFLGVFMVFAFTLASSVGLLRRRNWARICFMGVMFLGIAWNLVGLVFQYSMFTSMQQDMMAVPPEAALDMQAFFVVMAVVGVLFALAFSVLFGWIIRRLLSPEIAAEFRG